MKNRGFSLIELIVVLGIIAVIGATGFSVFKIWQNKNTLSSGKMILTSAFHEAKTMATMGNNDSDWGVKKLSGKVIVFSGSSYVSRDTSKDKIFDLPVGIIISDFDELIFTKFTGLPQSVLHANIFYGGESLQIDINSQGVFSD